MSNGGDASGAAEDVQFTNKPNTALLHLPDGLIVKTGEPYTFEGVSDAYDEAITAIEISLDNGETWVTYDLGQMCIRDSLKATARKRMRVIYAVLRDGRPYAA